MTPKWARRQTHRRFQGHPPPAPSQDAFRLHACPSSQGDGSDCESVADVNCRPLEEDLSNHNMAAGMWVNHDHRLRPKANRKSLPSGSVIFSTVHSAVNVLRCFINGFKTLWHFTQCKNCFLFPLSDDGSFEESGKHRYVSSEIQLQDTETAD